MLPIKCHLATSSKAVTVCSVASLAGHPTPHVSAHAHTIPESNTLIPFLGQIQLDPVPGQRDAAKAPPKDLEDRRQRSQHETALSCDTQKHCLGDSSFQKLIILMLRIYFFIGPMPKDTSAKVGCGLLRKQRPPWGQSQWHYLGRGTSRRLFLKP